MSYGKFFEEIRSNERLKVAHTFPKNKPVINIDDFDLFTEYASIGNLADLISRRLLLDQLDLHLKLINSGVLAEPTSLKKILESDRKKNHE